MKSYKMYPGSINEPYIDEIVDRLRRGEIIIYPTDTLYAIGCDALNNRAVERVCRLRGINPDKQRLSTVCADISQAAEFARINNEAFRIMRANLPGPFTFILPATTKLAKQFKGRHEVGIRVPDNPIAQRLAACLGNPLISATAEWPDAEPEELSSPESVAMHFENDVDMMINGGEGGYIPSAIVSLLDSSAPEIIRHGSLEPEF